MWLMILELRRDWVEESIVAQHENREMCLAEKETSVFLGSTRPSEESGLTSTALSPFLNSCA